METNWRKLRSGRLDWGIFRARHSVIREIRSFFDSRDYLETDAPLLTPYPTLDANILSVRADLRSETGRLHRMFLQSSPEYPMKKLLAAGASRIYFCGKAFRDGECTPLHNPEFTLLEWYRDGAGYADLMDETEALIRAAARRVLGTERVPFREKTLDLSPPWPRIPVRRLFREKTGSDLTPGIGLDSLKEIARRLNVHFNHDEDWETVFQRIFMEKVEPGLGETVPVFLTDYPLRLGLNAKRKTDDPEWTERVELYAGGLEIANGYTELTDASEQKSRFLSDQERKQKETGNELPVDMDLIDAMTSGLPPCAGIALGVDRLLMLLTDSRSIQDVLLFPFHQWE
jgi:elongation factor P--(R)-beta-lysine ligase